MPDEWLVLDLCGNGHRDPDGVVGVPSGISISDDCSQQRETDKNAAWRCQMKRARTPMQDIQDPDYCVES